MGRLLASVTAFGPKSPARRSVRPSPAHPRSGRLSRRFAFRSVRYCLIRLLPDAPSRVVRCCERPCLVKGGFPPSGPQEDLTTTCLTSLFCVHAEHTKAPFADAHRYAALTRPSALPIRPQLPERRRDQRRRFQCEATGHSRAQPPITVQWLDGTGLFIHCGALSEDRSARPDALAAHRPLASRAS